MKKIVLLNFLFLSFYSMTGQSITYSDGPIIKEYGKSFDIKNADLKLDLNKEYKIIFDVFTDNSKKNSVNPLINTVARFINMHAQQGVPVEHMKIVLILHGKATKSALNNLTYKKLYNSDNPNSELIEILGKAEVEIYVCGQSFLVSNYELKDVSENIKVSLSALTALVEYQSKGYQIINFN